MTLNISVSEIINKSNNPLLGKHKSWRRVLLHEIAKVQNGFAFNSNHFGKDGGLPLIRIRDIGKDVTETQYTGDYDPTYLVTAGDFLVGMDGDFNCSRWRGPKGLLNQRVCKIALLSEYFLPKFFDYALPPYLKAINDLTSSVTVKHLSSKSVEAIPLPLPPLDEQKRIVAEIGKQFSRLDEAVASLKRAKVSLKHYKAAVLKSAVEGKLTEQWRKEHPDVEPAEKLLQRILAERRMKLKKITEEESPEIKNLPNIPSTWLWVRLDTLADIKGGITKDSQRKIPKSLILPYLRVANVQRGYLDLSEMKHIEVPVDEAEKLLLEAGDILFNEGGDRDKLGRGWIWEGQIKNCTFQNHVFRARLFLKGINGKFISWFGNNYGQNYFIAKGKQTTNLASINKTMLSAFPVPLPPLLEQQYIVGEVESQISEIRQMEEMVEANLKRADRLRQSILKKAFSGKLVPQDPNDEPAAVLLEHIRSQKEQHKGREAGSKSS